MSDILIPSFGESITAATVAAWHKGSGDAVARGDTLVTLETDKVSTDLEADEDGMLEILVPEGAEAPIGAVLGRIAPSAGTSVPEKEEATVLPEPENTPQPDVKKAASPPEELPEQAHEPSETLREKQSAGPEQAAPRFIRKPMSPLRRTIAARLAQVQHQAAILTTFNECDMSAVMELRRQFNASFRERYGTKLGLMGFFIKAAVKALKEVPQVNAKIDGTDIVENLYYDISVAIGTDKGLMVPVLRDCDRKTLPELELELAALAEKARKGALSMQDLQGGCFTISNGGTYGSLLSTPILNPPQSGILGMHAIQERPVVRDGQITIRPASALQRISTPLCICCFVLSNGSCRVPNGEVMNRNSSRSTGNEYPVPCSAPSEVWSGLCSTPNCRPCAVISCITCLSYFCKPFCSMIFCRFSAYLPPVA